MVELKIMKDHQLSKQRNLRFWKKQYMDTRVYKFDYVAINVITT